MYLRYSSNWKLLLLEKLFILFVGKLSVPKSQKSSHLWSRVKWWDSICHSGIGIFNLVWAVTSKPVKIISRLFLLWAGYDLGFWLGMKLVEYRDVTMCLQRSFKGNQFFFIFKNLLFVSCWKLSRPQFLACSKVQSHIFEARSYFHVFLT